MPRDRVYQQPEDAAGIAITQSGQDFRAARQPLTGRQLFEVGELRCLTPTGHAGCRAYCHTMEESAQRLGKHVTPSPSGLLLACVVEQVLKISYTRAPEQCLDFAIQVPAFKIKSLIWAHDSSRVLVFSSKLVEVVNLEDDEQRARLENGTEGLGRFEAAAFLSPESVITIWEFGRAKVWNLVHGRTQDIENIKTMTNGHSWAQRPRRDTKSVVVAYISRPAAEDMLSVLLLEQQVADQPYRMATIDAQSLSWSPDGNWIAVLDSPQHMPGLHLFTADGQFFRSFPKLAKQDSGLGIESITWSPDSRHMVIASHDNPLELIATRTMSRVALLAHPTTISQDMIARQVLIWQESISPSKTRSYSLATHSFAPPLSQKSTIEQPHGSDMKTAVFDCKGKYLATRDGSTPGVIWIWDIEVMQLRTVLIQHDHVQTVHWHTSISGLVLIDAGENIAHLWDVSSESHPQVIEIPTGPRASFTFVPSHSQSTHAIILASNKDGYRVLYPHGRNPTKPGTSIDFVDGDSIFEVLSGGGSLSNAEASMTQRIAYEAELDGGTARLDDTFRMARKDHNGTVDPLDDSEIF